MRRFGVAVLGVLGLAIAAPAHAGLKLAEWRGHLAAGYSHLFIDDAPGGSLSVAAGVDYPASETMRFGVDIEYHLLGSKTVQEGSLLADVDYSQLDLVGLVHWSPGFTGPISRISAGVGVFHANASLATSGGGAAFSHFAVDEVVPGVSLSANLMSRKPSTLKLALEVGGRVALVEDETWSMALARVAVHY
jgi:hypothetical protein